MFTKRFYPFVASALVLTLAACSPAVPVDIPQSVPVTVLATQEVVAIATSAPYATQAPYPTATLGDGSDARLTDEDSATIISGEPNIYPTPLPTPGTVPTPVDNFFNEYGVNPFVETTADHLSTFAIDVDTASYSVVRRYVEEGNLPPAEAVRVEEFVNYFEQGYQNPDNVAFGLYADGAPSPFHTDGTYLMRIGIQGYEVPEATRKPANLTFVIDVSGSMAMENRLELVKQALTLLVERLRADDTVAIVVYGSTARVHLNPTNGSDKETILQAIFALYPEGATNAEAGLQLAYQLAEQMQQPGEINRVVLCSDGVANVGNTGPDAILKSIKAYALEYGISLTTVGFGMGNYNDVLMEQLANDGNGHYAYVDDLDEARKLFVDDLTATLQVIALDAKVQVDFNPETVARYRLLGYENRAVADENFRNDAVDAGEIGAGHTVTAIYAVQLKPGTQGRLATVQLRWKTPETYAVSEINGNFNTWDLAPTFEATTPRYQLAATVAQYAEVLRHSPYAANTTFTQILSHVARLAEALPGDKDVSELAFLVSRAAQIAR